METGAFIRRLALILGISVAALASALADGRAKLPPRDMVQDYLHNSPHVTRDSIMMAMGIMPGLGGQLGFMVGGPVGTIWNSADKTAGAAITGGGLILNSPAAGTDGARATKSLTNPTKRYFEIKLAGGSASIAGAKNIYAGLSPVGGDLTNAPGSARATFGLYNTGVNDWRFYEQVGDFFASTGVSTASGAILHFAIDGATAYYGVNGRWGNSGGSSLSTPQTVPTDRALFPFAGTKSSDDNWTLNTKGTTVPFSYLPSGYTAWG